MMNMYTIILGKLRALFAPKQEPASILEVKREACPKHASLHGGLIFVNEQASLTYNFFPGMQ